MLAGEFLHVAIEMLGRYFVKRSGMRPLEHGPKRLDPVGVRLPANVLRNGVLDRLMRIREGFIHERIVGVDRGIQGDVGSEEAVNRGLVRRRHHLRDDLVRVPVFHSGDDRLASRTPARTLLRKFGALGVRHVLPLPAHVRLVGFDRTLERLSAARFRHPCFADAMEHEPRGRLAHPDVPVQLHGRNGFEAGKAKVDRDGPLAKRDLGVGERGSGLDAEVAPAVRAPVRHLRVRGFPCAHASALPAASAIRPVDRLEPRCGCDFIREHVHYLDQGEPFAEVLARCLVFRRHVDSPELVGERYAYRAALSTFLCNSQHELEIEFTPAKGKSQVLDFRRRLQADRTGLAIGVFMFVDRDFDGLRGQLEGDDIFCTETYSIENYLVSDAILKSILTDEFRCTAQTDHRDNILSLFQQVLVQFNDCMKEANRRIFLSRFLGIQGVGIQQRISTYVEITLRGVRKVYDNPELRRLINLDREPTLDERQVLDAEFELLVPQLDYRGKFLVAFFGGWLERLSEERMRHGQTLFPETGNVHFSRTTLTLRSLASRAPLPDGLEHFVQTMRRP